MKTSRLDDSGLLTSGHHHVPGYGGFCPQYKFNYGKTFGKMTAALMSDKDIATSGNPVLGQTIPEPSHKDKVEEFRSYLINTRDGDQKYGGSMIPGYMGFVPRTKNYFGSRYTEVCRNSTADLELDRRKVEYRKEEMEFIKAVQDGKIELAPEDMPPHLILTPRAMSTEQGRASNSHTPRPSNTQTPRPSNAHTPIPSNAHTPRPSHSQTPRPSNGQTPIPNAHTPRPTRSSTQTPREILMSCDPRSYSTSPYDINNQDPGKTFKAGYAGFVPRARELFGQGFPEICNKALNTFQGDRLYHQQVLDETVNMRKYLGPPLSPRPLYPEETGMTPRYTGHVPGVRFRHGMTFGRSTKNTKDFQMPDISI